MKNKKRCFFEILLFLTLGFFVIGEKVQAAVPVISNVAPSGTLATGTTNITLSLQTDVVATCRYTYHLSTAYNDPTYSYAFNTVDGLAHSKSLTYVENTTTGQIFHFFVYCADGEGNVNSTPHDLTFSVNADAPPTLRSATQNELTDTTASLELFSTELVACRYSATAGVSFNLMTNIFDDSGTYHYKKLTGLTPNTSYTYYVRCAYPIEMPNTSDFLINFTTLSEPDVLSPAAPSGLTIL